MGSGLHAVRWRDGVQEKQGEKKTAQNTVNLLTATVKVDSDDPALRFCFRVISPEKTYTLQADSDLDRQEWMTAIQARPCLLPCFHSRHTSAAQQCIHWRGHLCSCNGASRLCFSCSSLGDWPMTREDWLMIVGALLTASRQPGGKDAGGHSEGGG